MTFVKFKSVISELRENCEEMFSWNYMHSDVCVTLESSTTEWHRNVYWGIIFITFLFFRYNCGDVLMVKPENSDEAVSEFCKLFNLNPTDILDISQMNEGKSTCIFLLYSKMFSQIWEKLCNEVMWTDLTKGVLCRHFSLRDNNNKV